MMVVGPHGWSGLAPVPVILRVWPAGEEGETSGGVFFCKTCSPGIAARSGYYVHFGGRTFQTERNKLSPVKWTVDFSFVEMHPQGKVGWKTISV